MRSEFSAVPFQDLVKAEANLARIEQRLPSTLWIPLASLLSTSPDPDGALNLFERYILGAPPDVLSELARTPTALSYLVATFGASAFLSEIFLAEPGLAIQFARDRNFTKLKSKEDLMQDYARFSTTDPDPWLSSQLARFKQRNYLRLVLKDVLGLSTLGETTLELSALADVILTNTLLFCDLELEKRYGQPQYRDPQGRIARSGFSIMSLGKLGGNELNYSSDIDLLFLYAHDGETAGGSERDSVISNKEYFVRLAHAITGTLTQSTPYGQVFRVDLRLRPEGEQGDLAISLKSALEYYEHRARDWELQMLIKARHSSGDSKLTREFLRGAEPYIYGSPTDFAAVESVLWAREKMPQKMRDSRGTAIDVKRHRGGIRDIEFLTQCLQRLVGRHDPWVRSGGTLLALRKLNDKGWLSDSDCAALTSAYESFRRVEHRIQLEAGHQTHRLPVEPESLDRLARRVGIECGGDERPGQALMRQLQQKFQRVDEIYQRVIHPRPGVETDVAFKLRPPDAVPLEGAHSYESIQRYLDAHAPELASVLREVSPPVKARRNTLRFFTALLSSSERFRLAREQPHAVRRALEVLSASEYLADLLIHHPEEMVVLDSGPGAAPAPALADVGEHLHDAPATESDREGREGPPLRGRTHRLASQQELGLETSEDARPFGWARGVGLGIREKMALLRRNYRARILELGAADLAGGRSIFSALGCWSALARQAISSAVEIAREALEESRATRSASPSNPLVVLGLGRLGLNEFDLASDADLIFVLASETPHEEIAFWTRMAEKTIEVLSSYTRDGTIFAIDTRLGPRGQDGELIVTEDAFLHYIREAAQVWEALTYLKACPVAGNLPLGRETVLRIIACLEERFASYPKLEEELHLMRPRLEREVSASSTDAKTAPGGYHDVDFAVSFLRLRHRLSLPPGQNLAEQVAALSSARLIGSEDACSLTDGAAFLRSVDHAIRLVTGKGTAGLPEQLGHAEAVESLMRRWGLVRGDESLANRLRKTQQQIRNVYGRLVASH